MIYTMIKEFLIYFISVAISMRGAYWIATRKINRSFTVTNRIMYYYFALNFALAIGLFSLLMQELIFFKNRQNILQRRLWFFEIKVLNFNLLFVSPVLIIVESMNFVKFGRLKKIIIFSLIFVYLYYLIASLKAEADSMENFRDMRGIKAFFVKILSKEVQFNYLVRLGGIIISCLSGFGAVDIPLENFVNIDKFTLEQNYKNITESFKFLMDQMRTEKLRLNNVMQMERPRAETSKRSFFGNLFGAGRTPYTEKKEILDNIKANRKLFKSTYSDYLELKKDFDKNLDKKRNLALFYINRYFSIILMIVSIQKVLSTTITLILGRNSKGKDPVLKMVSVGMR